VSSSLYHRLGIRPVINGMGTYTALGGSLMPREVLDAMAEAACCFVPIAELQEKVGARIAELLGVPSAMVTAGAASAITVGTAACIARGCGGVLAQFPEFPNGRPEVILQKSHRSGYEPQIALTGAKLVWVETRQELERAIGERTAMLCFLNRHEPLGLISREEWILVGKDRGIPTFNDAAADIPPPDHLWKLVREGFDLVAFSGGKALRGPQSTGLLLGRADLVATARQALSPHLGIGRGMKVGKEEMMGLLAAVERYLKADHEAEKKLWEKRAEELVERLGAIAGMNVRIDVPQIANHVPHVILEWSQWHHEWTAAEVSDQLLRGDPPIAILTEGERSLRIAVWTLVDNQHRIVSDRIAEILSARR